jgi:hypothetical protein
VTKKTIGFGFNPERSIHYFVVHIPSSASGEAPVKVVERFDWKGEVPSDIDIGPEHRDLRIVIPRERWNEVVDECRAEFNRRLTAHGYPTGKWATKGAIPIDRGFGKELLLLLWAIEDADPTLIPNATRNWLGLSPEERWWLYTMTAAATGQAFSGRNKGWRKAVRFALCENPVTEGIIRKRPAIMEPSLFEEND